MASVEVTLNGHDYSIACSDGEEAQISELGAQVEAKLQEVVSMVGQIGDQRLLVMSAILLADDLKAARNRIATSQEAGAALEKKIHELEARLDSSESRAADKLEAAAQQVERVLAGLPDPAETAEPEAPVPETAPATVSEADQSL